MKKDIAIGMVLAGAAVENRLAGLRGTSGNPAVSGGSGWMEGQGGGAIWALAAGAEEADEAGGGDLGGVRVLITRRPTGAVYAGYWEFPGGKVEAGETVEQAVVRELWEELGVEVEPVAALAAVEHVYPHGHVVLLPWVCRVVAGEPRNLGVSEHRWVGMGELGGYRFPEANVGLIAELKGWLAT